MNQDDYIYDEAKEILRKYGRNFQKSENEKVIYESAAIIFSLRKEYKEDTRNYNVPKSIYNIYQDMILKLQNRINKNEVYKEEAEQACLKALTFIDLIVGSRIDAEAFAS
ncbi:MAG: hypothetical protein K0S61_3591 [Anaerocolumna sp.]|jgi:hypothetical protein|nr:hypothetical protein [Anaerocolumna sp.]